MWFCGDAIANGPVGCQPSRRPMTEGGRRLLGWMFRGSVLWLVRCCIVFNTAPDTGKARSRRDGSLPVVMHGVCQGTVRVSTSCRGKARTNVPVHGPRPADGRYSGSSFAAGCLPVRGQADPPRSGTLGRVHAVTCATAQPSTKCRRVSGLAPSAPGSHCLG